MPVYYVCTARMFPINGVFITDRKQLFVSTITVSNIKMY